MLKPATRFRNSTHLSWVLVLSDSRISPPIRPAPTMPTGEFRSRGASLKMEFHSAGIRAGMATTALAAAPMKSPVRVTAAPKDCATYGEVTEMPRKPACLTPIWLPWSSSTGRCVLDDRDRLGDLLAVPDVRELDRGAGGALDQVGQLRPTGHRDAIEFDDLVAGQQSGQRSRGLRIRRQAFGLLGGPGRGGRNHALADRADRGARGGHPDTDHQDTEDARPPG